MTISNTGGPTVGIQSIALTGSEAGDFALTANTCGTSLPTQTGCTVSIVFRPTASGVRTAALTVTDDVGGADEFANRDGYGSCDGHAGSAGAELWAADSEYDVGGAGCDADERGGRSADADCGDYYGGRLYGGESLWELAERA